MQRNAIATKADPRNGAGCRKSHRSGQFPVGARAARAAGILAWLFLLSGLAGAAGAAAPSETIRVATTAELVRALDRASDGARIVLAPGTYAPVTLSDHTFEDAVTISAEAPGAAFVERLRLHRIAGLTVRGLRVDASGKPTSRSARPNKAGVEVLDAKRIRLEHNRIHGSVDGNYDNDRMGLFVTQSNDIKIIQNEFHDLFIAARLRETSDLSFVRNSVTDVTKDALNFVGVRRTCIADNWVSGTHPDELVHTDFIQFWNKGSDVPASNVTIKGNILIQSNIHSTQAIFINDPPPEGYENFVIEKNLVYTSSYHGITIADARNSRIAHNTIMTFPGLQWVAHINAKGQNVQVRNNTATGFKFEGGTVTQRSNRKIKYTRSAKGTEENDWLDELFESGSANMNVVKHLIRGQLEQANDTGAVPYMRSLVKGNAALGCPDMD